MQRYCSILTLTFAISLTSYGQSTNITTLFVSDFKKAEDFYKVLAYRNAVELYLHYEEKHQGDPLTMERIADCYSKLNNYSEAATWYARLVVNPNSKPIIHFNYAQTLCMIGDYDGALKAYRHYQQLEKNDGR
ncbi:MAG TPA: hypothetical protein VGD40_17855, partial [Chryseosolibacter sp.]